MRLLLVDDDPGLRALVRTTFEVVDVDLDEAETADEAEDAIRVRRPDAILLDLSAPSREGAELCRELRASAATRDIPVVLLTQVLPYARELRRLLESERGEAAGYGETVAALARALEWKDTGTRAHSQRVERYAIELAATVAPGLADSASARYGFLLHDVGKIAIPDELLRKPQPLSTEEARLMRAHTVLGEQLLAGVAVVRGPGLEIVRHHHERWDGRGYPDARRGPEIPLGARVFAVADTLDAITSDRPYREARSWDWARVEILDESGGQFDPDVVEAFRAREPDLRTISRELAGS